MTDPNVIEALNALGDAVAHLLTQDAVKARRSLATAVASIDLLAAAGKPAEAAPVVTGGIQYDPEGHAISPTTGKPAHVDPDGWFGFANKERAGVYVEAHGLESARRAVRAMRDAGIAAVRGEAAPVVVPLNPTDFAVACLRNSGIDVACGACMEVAFTGATTAAHTCTKAAPAAPALPWVIRHEDGKVIAAFDDEQFARDCADRCNLPPFFRVAAAPTVAAVKFTDDGDAFGTDWEATRSSAKDSVFVTITLRPGEDAGVTTERTLAAVGMGS